MKVRLELPSPLPVAWDVMTDYAGAGRFIHNLRRSEVSVLGPDELLVDQVGWLGWGIMGVSIQTSYRIHLNPAQHQLAAKLVSGDLSFMEMTASLLAPQAHRTVLLYDVSVDPGAWIPYFLAEKVLRQQAHDAFTDLATEMQRRSQTCPMTPGISENPT